jgi:hypothetical protein
VEILIFERRRSKRGIMASIVSHYKRLSSLTTVGSDIVTNIIARESRGGGDGKDGDGWTS